MLKKTVVVFMLLTFVTMGSAYAVDTVYDNAAGGLWSDASKWDAGVPGPDDHANLVTAVGSEVVVPASTTASCRALIVGSNATNTGLKYGAVTVNGTLDLSPSNHGGGGPDWGAVIFGYYGENTGILNVNAGASVISENSSFVVGQGGTGIVNVNGGYMKISQLVMADGAGSTGIMHLNAGQVDLNFKGWGLFLEGGPFVGGGTNRLIDIGEGVLTVHYGFALEDDVTFLATFNSMVANNTLVAQDAGKWINIYNDTANSQYVITAVPEPLTMSLLGLGGLFLARRRNA